MHMSIPTFLREKENDALMLHLSHQHFIGFFFLKINLFLGEYFSKGKKDNILKHTMKAQGMLRSKCCKRQILQKQNTKTNGSTQTEIKL